MAADFLDTSALAKHYHSEVGSERSTSFGTITPGPLLYLVFRLWKLSQCSPGRCEQVQFPL